MSNRQVLSESMSAVDIGSILSVDPEQSGGGHIGAMGVVRENLGHYPPETAKILLLQLNDMNLRGRLLLIAYKEIAERNMMQFACKADERNSHLSLELKYVLTGIS